MLAADRANPWDVQKYAMSDMMRFSVFLMQRLMQDEETQARFSTL